MVSLTFHKLKAHPVSRMGLFSESEDPMRGYMNFMNFSLASSIT